MPARWLALLTLLLAEGLGLGIAFDGAALAALAPGWWTPVLRAAGAVMPASAALIAALVLFGWARARSPHAPPLPAAMTAMAETAAADPLRRFLPYLLVHLAGFVLVLAFSHALFDADSAATLRPGALVATWLAAVAVTGLAWLGALAPPAQLLGAVRTRVDLLAGAAALGGVAFLVGRLAQGLWMPLRQTTFMAAALVLSALSPTAVADPASLELGAEQFLVKIAPSCSGYEGVGMTVAFILAALWLFRARFRFPRAWLLLVPATILPFIANICRLASLVLLGAYVSPELAQGGTHSYAGSILFCALALGIVVVGLRTTWLTRAGAPAAESAAAPAPAATTAPAYLVPFLVMTAAGLLSRAFSAGGEEPLYALRPAAGLIALVIFHRVYRRLEWPVSPLAIGAGLGVAALWVALDRWLPGGALAAGAPAAAPLVAARAAAAILLVPAVEELAFRGFLARRIAATNFDSVPATSLPWRGIVGSAIAFGLLHARPVAGVAAGLVYGAVYRRRGAVADAIVAHAATNAALIAVTAITGRWELWY